MRAPWRKSGARRGVTLFSSALPLLGLLGMAFSLWGPGPPESVRSDAMTTSNSPEAATTESRLDQLGDRARSRLTPYFQRAGVAYPPQRALLVGLKRERRLELYADGNGDGLRFIRSWPVLGASGGPGPKLEQGDRQVPEGFYRVTSLNPNSRYHLSLRLDYPNDFDLAMASREGRSNPGGDIMIHGGDRSVGCLAVGDAASEELFVLAAETGLERVETILAPLDFRLFPDVAAESDRPAWVGGLYSDLKNAFDRLPVGGRTTVR